MAHDYLPEGRLLHTPENRARCAGLRPLAEAMEGQTVLEGTALLCDENHDLLVRLPSGLTGRIPRAECALGVAEGATREIAILSRVGKPVSFMVQSLEGESGLLLSRRRAQEAALDHILSAWSPGQIVPATVTHLDPFGAFVDVGCGVPSLIGIDRLSVSRIPHARERLQVGQEILAAVLDLDREKGRVSLTLRELLGTWQENAALFRPGVTIPGVVRGVRDYGIFVELTPNLSGLAEFSPGVREGDRYSVYLKAIQPERMKLKLLLIDPLPREAPPMELRYFVKDGILDRWVYPPEGCHKAGGETVFRSETMVRL